MKEKEVNLLKDNPINQIDRKVKHINLLKDEIDEKRIQN